MSFMVPGYEAMRRGATACGTIATRALTEALHLIAGRLRYEERYHHHDDGARGMTQLPGNDMALGAAIPAFVQAPTFVFMQHAPLPSRSEILRQQIAAASRTAR
ncbi:hypothetical protein ASE95_00510 [Sphingomonas sp. Leaf231]|nr:hypothetical protein ASE95_00510 [Sphingomonas sp. Leaf231]